MLSDPVILLAGGLGTRLKPVVADRPKVLAPVGDRPFLAFVLADLAEQGVGRVVIAGGHGAAMIDAWLAHARLPAGLDVELIREREPLGTGGAVRFARAEAGIAGWSWVLNGDTWLPGGLGAMARRARTGRAAIALVEVLDAGRYGRVLRGADCRVTGFVEKGDATPGAINAGLYRLDGAAFEGAQAGAFSLERETLPRLAAAGALDGWSLDLEFVDIGVPDDYRRFCRLMARAGAAS